MRILGFCTWCLPSYTASPVVPFEQDVETDLSDSLRKKVSIESAKVDGYVFNDLSDHVMQLIFQQVVEQEGVADAGDSLRLVCKRWNKIMQEVRRQNVEKYAGELVNKCKDCEAFVRGFEQSCESLSEIPLNREGLQKMISLVQKSYRQFRCTEVSANDVIKAFCDPAAMAVKLEYLAVMRLY